MNQYLLVGEKNRLKINRYTDNGVYLICDDQDEVLMPNQYVTYAMKEGDEIDVFVYFDSEDRIVASTTFPKAMLDEFACFEVVDVTEFGAFLDWGLPQRFARTQSASKVSVLRRHEGDRTGQFGRRNRTHRRNTKVQRLFEKRFERTQAQTRC